MVIGAIQHTAAAGCSHLCQEIAQDLTGLTTLLNQRERGTLQCINIETAMSLRDELPPAFSSECVTATAVAARIFLYAAQAK